MQFCLYMKINSSVACLNDILMAIIPARFRSPASDDVETRLGCFCNGLWGQRSPCGDSRLGCQGATHLLVRLVEETVG
jgi:hypothetical protein